MDEYPVRTWEGWHHYWRWSCSRCGSLIGETHWGQQVTPALTRRKCATGWSACPDGGVLYVQHRLYLSSSAAPINAQRVGPLYHYRTL
jgi:hypothetical protein